MTDFDFAKRVCEPLGIQVVTHPDIPNGICVGGHEIIPAIIGVVSIGAVRDVPGWALNEIVFSTDFDGFEDVDVRRVGEYQSFTAALEEAFAGEARHYFRRVREQIGLEEMVSE